MRDFSGSKYTRVRKDVARKLFHEGVTIYLTPCNIVPSDDNMWIGPIPMTNKYGLHSFDGGVNEFEYHNCNYELGYYAAYYINEEEVK